MKLKIVVSVIILCLSLLIIPVLGETQWTTSNDSRTVVMWNTSSARITQVVLVAGGGGSGASGYYPGGGGGEGIVINNYTTESAVVIPTIPEALPHLQAESSIIHFPEYPISPPIITSAAVPMMVPIFLILMLWAIGIRMNTALMLSVLLYWLGAYFGWLPSLGGWGTFAIASILVYNAFIIFFSRDSNIEEIKESNRRTKPTKNKKIEISELKEEQFKSAIQDHLEYIAEIPHDQEPSAEAVVKVEEMPPQKSKWDQLG
jgi:hypothetical protein